MPVKSEDVRRWISAELIDPATGDRILAFETARSAERQSSSDRPTVPELLIYVAAAIVAAGFAVLASTNWEHLASAARIAIPGIAAALMLAGGYVLRQARIGALVRGASLSWLLAGALICATVAIAAAEGGWSEGDVALSASVAALISSVALWNFLRMHPQVAGIGAAALLFSIAISTHAAEHWTIGVLGISLASFGLMGLIATEVGVLVPRASARLVAGAALAAGAFWTGMPPVPPLGEAIALVVVLLLLAAGIRVQSLVYIAFGVLAAFAGLLTLVLRHVKDPTLAGIALIVVGLLLLLVIAGLRQRLSWAQWGWLSRHPTNTPTARNAA
jgi:hypothetical protein